MRAEPAFMTPEQRADLYECARSFKPRPTCFSPFARPRIRAFFPLILHPAGFCCAGCFFIFPFLSRDFIIHIVVVCLLGWEISIGSEFTHVGRDGGINAVSGIFVVGMGVIASETVLRLFGLIEAIG